MKSSWSWELVGGREVGGVEELVRTEWMKHTATLVGHKVYVLGGQPEYARESDIFILDLKTKSWSKVKLTQIGFHNFRLFGHTTTLVNDELVTIGGFGATGRTVGYLKRISILDVVTLEGREEFPKFGLVKTEEFEGHTTNYEPIGSSLFVFGGIGSTYSSELRILNIVKDTWIALLPRGNGPSARAHHTSALVGDSLVIFGGRSHGRRKNDIYIYSIPENSWTSTTISGRPPPEVSSASMICYKSYLLLFGGGLNGRGQRVSNRLFCFDLDLGIWREVRTEGLVTPTLSHVAIFARKSMFVIGGKDRSTTNYFRLVFKETHNIEERYRQSS